MACSFVLCSRIQYSQKGVLINTVFCVTLGSSDAVAPYRKTSKLMLVIIGLIFLAIMSLIVLAAVGVHWFFNS